MPVVLQVDETDCGVACLAMLARHHGRHVEIAALRDAADADRSGTSLAGLTEAGALAGLSVEGFELSAGALDGLALPAIAHVDADHWVVVERVGTGHVDVVDPAAGPARLERSEFAQRWTGFVAVVTPVAPAPVVGAGPRSRWRWLVPLVRARRRAIAGALALTVLGVALELAVPVLVQRIVDSTVRGDALRASLVVALLFSVAGVIALDTARERLLVRTAVQIDASMLDLVTGRLLQLPVAYFRRRRAGDVERRITGLGEVRRVVLHQGIEAFTAVLLVVGCGLTIAVLSPLLGVVFAAVLLANAAIMRASVTRVRPMFAALEESFGRYASRQLDLVRGIETVRVHGAERAARQRMRVAFDTLRRRTEPARLALVTHQVRTRALGLATTTAFVLAGAREAHAGRLSIGGYVAVLSLVALATPALVTVIRSWDDVQMSSVLLERIREVVEHEHSDRDGVDRGTDDGVDDRVDARTPSEVPNDASVVVRGLEVRVGRRVVLSGIDLDVAAGRLVAIVGRSGSGKSTLLRVLAGIEAPTSGTVHLGGAAIERIEPIVLRSHLGAVLQQPYVFDGTIAENVGFAEPHTPIGVPDEQAVADALWAAALDELVAAMPLGLATRVGEGGRTLAGGEAQRLALARALHRRPRVLLLDEPTSALDPEAEELVRARLRATAAGRTTFLVTHRLRVAADADEILVLDHGRVVERGPHDELLAADGVYAHLWRGGSA